MKKLVFLTLFSVWFCSCATAPKQSQKDMRTLTQISRQLAMVDESLTIVNQRLESKPKDRTLTSIKHDLVEQKKSLERRQRYYQAKI